MGKSFKTSPCSILLFDNVYTEIFAENVGNVNATVSVLVLLNHGGENTAGGKSASVESVNVLDSAVLSSDTHHAAARLIVTRVGNRADFLVAVHGRNPSG